MVSELVKYTPNIGLAYLDSYLSQFGYNVKIFNFTFDSLSNFINEIKSAPPDVIGVSAFTEDYNSAHRILKLIKKINRNILTVMGGPHASGNPKESLESIKYLDFVVIGEGELSFKELLDNIYSDHPEYGVIPGIGYRKEQTVVINKLRNEFVDLNEIPIIDWEKYGENVLKYYKKDNDHFDFGLPIMSQRGCPFNCVFCQKVLGGRVREKNIEKVFAEIKFNYEKHGITRFFIADETFSIKKTRILKFCKMIIKEELHKVLKWSCLTRVDLIDEEIIRNLKLAGCNFMFYGIESGSEYILKKIRKGITLSKAVEAIRLAKKYQIQIEAGYILALPYDSLSTMNQTLQFALKNRTEIAVFALLTPYPGSQCYQYAQDNIGGLRLISQDWDHYNKMWGQSIELDNITPRFLSFFQIYCYLRYYLHPKSLKFLFKVVKISNLIQFLIEKLKIFYSS